MRRFIIAIVVLGALALSAVLVTQHQQQPVITNEAAPTSGYYLKNIEARYSNESGELTYLLQADAMIEQPAQQSIDLTNIEVNYFTNQSEDFWRVTANQGHIDQASEHIFLRNQVQVFAPADELLGTYLSAPSLTIDTRRHTARSKGPVYIEQPPHRLQSDTFFADLHTNEVTLSGDVSGQFDAGT